MQTMENHTTGHKGDTEDFRYIALRNPIIYDIERTRSMSHISLKIEYKKP